MESPSLGAAETNGTQLAEVAYQRPAEPGGFPFSVPAIAHLERLTFPSPVTVLVGENGTGKSTFMEALAIACRLPAVGSARLESDRTLAAQRSLADRFRLTWRGRTHRGFFLRAEDFFGFQKQIAEAKQSTRRRSSGSTPNGAGLPTTRSCSPRDRTAPRSERWSSGTEPTQTRHPTARHS